MYCKGQQAAAHKQESGGDDHDEVAFKQVIQFSPEQLADDKSKYHRNNYRKIQISWQCG